MDQLQQTENGSFWTYLIGPWNVILVIGPFWSGCFSCQYDLNSYQVIYVIMEVKSNWHEMQVVVGLSNRFMLRYWLRITRKHFVQDYCVSCGLIVWNFFQITWIFAGCQSDRVRFWQPSYLFLITYNKKCYFVPRGMY